jgi:WD40 repeat protein
MVCCLNPDCPNPQNPDGLSFCQSCGTFLVPLLRGHYRLILPLGRGGGSRTYLAEDINQKNQHCIVRQLAPKVKETRRLKKAVELFEQEAKQLQELGEHPQIPTVCAYFKQDGYLYLVREFIHGQNLWQLLQLQGVWKESEIRELLLDLLPVLKFIHSRQVIHRDIKPENIIRRRTAPSPNQDETKGGQFVLINFDCCKLVSENALSKLGAKLENQSYAPPEKIQGSEVCAASDLFSLGATCFALITGVHPFQLLAEHGYNWTANWRQYLKSPISEELAGVIDKLLQKDIQKRYQSAEEVLKYLRPEPVLQAPPTSGGQSKNSLFAGAAILLLAVAGYQYCKATQPDFDLLGQLTAPLSLSQPIASPTPSQPIASPTPSQPIASPTPSQPISVQAKTIASKNSILLNTLTGHTDSICFEGCIAITPDGKTLVTGSLDSTIKVWDLATGSLRATLTGHVKDVNSIAISPDGKTLVSGGDDSTVKVWDLATGTVRATLTGHTGGVSAVAISADGLTAVSGSWDSTIKVWDLATGTLKTTIAGNSNDVNAVAISPDGRTLVSGGDDSTVKVWDLATGKERATLTDHTDSVWSVAISPDGRTLVSGSWDKTIKVWDMATGTLTTTLTGHTDRVSSVAISPDGRTLVSGSWDSTIKVWDLGTGTLKITLKGHTSPVWSVAISPDRQKIISGSGDKTIKIWRMPKL